MQQKEWSDDNLTGPDPRIPQSHSSKSAEEAMKTLNAGGTKEEPEEIEEAADSKTPANAEEFAEGVEKEKRNNGVGPAKPMRD